MAVTYSGNAATTRTNLGLGNLATANSVNSIASGTTTPSGSAGSVFVDTNDAQFAYHTGSGWYLLDGTGLEYAQAQTATSYSIYNASGNYTIPNNTGNVVYGFLYGGGGGGHWGNYGNMGGRGAFVSGISDAGWAKGQTKNVTCGAGGGIGGTGGDTSFASGGWVAQGGIGNVGNVFGYGDTSGQAAADSTEINVGGQRLGANNPASWTWTTYAPNNTGTRATGGSSAQAGGAVIYY